ncbi:Ger(x)C family spore germination protein [Paenibacillus sp. OAS669]|uniref:Ger(x)C family spore germination protein n=1 Tax=Paenibacillus sp. OAS669 TaxID=2663821 RepID=UPI00178BC25B|nr:Ger(x)C family spore germination protein [Paenibacillus sp. OAS669]MBE1441617.1 spore germination protein [Paenibacillus sp. OAS669]
MDKTRWMAGLLLLIFLTGCGDQRVLERVGFIQTTTYDLMPDGTYKIVIALPKVDPESKVSRDILATVAHSVKEAKINLSKKSSLMLVNGQIRNVLFGLAVAKKGLDNHFDTLARDPSISPHMKITLVDGNAGAIMEKTYSHHKNIGKYIDHLLEKESKQHAVPKVTLYSFLRDYYDDGIDPVAPVIKDIGEGITIDAVGLFRDNKYIDKISSKETMILAVLRDSFKRGNIAIPLDKNNPTEVAMFNSLISRRKVNIIPNSEGKPAARILVRIKGTLLEYTGDLKLGEDKDRRELEKKISAFLTAQGNQMIRFMQSKKVDSLGIGTYVRNQMSYSGWKKMDWHEEYSKMDIQCRIQMEIKNYGKIK